MNTTLHESDINLIVVDNRMSLKGNTNSEHLGKLLTRDWYQRLQQLEASLGIITKIGYTKSEQSKKEGKDIFSQAAAKQHSSEYVCFALYKRKTVLIEFHTGSYNVTHTSISKYFCF